MNTQRNLEQAQGKQFIMSYASSTMPECEIGWSDSTARIYLLVTDPDNRRLAVVLAEENIEIAMTMKAADCGSSLETTFEMLCRK